MLNIYNTLSRKKSEFKPIEPGKVKIYVCGMTVYDHCHLGHARVMVVFDLVVRYLRALSYEVNYIRNITDIDDKIINRALENNEPFDQLTNRFIQSMHDDSDALDIMLPDEEPRATTSIDQIVNMIQILVEKEIAYIGENGDVYYSISKFPEYGQLSGKNLADLEAGTRVNIDEAKKNPLDFVLWKAAKPAEPSWPSPWGNGRPGWHIECSAMSTHCLGNHFDIHGGGMDLQFPHHENEIAQSEAATGQKFVNVWMHNGFVRVNEEKMSKSLGNFFTVKEILKQYRGEEIRYFILTSQYRSPLNYSDQQLDAARTSLTRFYTALRGIKIDESHAYDFHNESLNRFFDAMNDDFNTPEALAFMFELTHELNQAKTKDLVKAQIIAEKLIFCGKILGILQQDPETFFKQEFSNSHSLSDTDIDLLINLRISARKNKDWTEADRVRNELTENGIILEDGPDGTTWRRQ